MKVLIVYAHPEPTSLTRQMVDVTAETLSAAGHTVIHSDLYGMKWKAVYDADDFPVRDNPKRLSFIMEEKGIAQQVNVSRRAVAKSSTRTRTERA